MILLWAVAGLALVLSVVSYFITRGTARKLEHMTEMYWQLKFEHGELKARLEPAAPPSAQARTTFVPLDSLTGRRPDDAGPLPGSGGKP